MLRDPSQFADELMASCAAAAEKNACDVERVLYSAALALFGHFSTETGTSRGELADSLGLYESLAFYILDAESCSFADGPPKARCEERDMPLMLSRLLDENLPPALTWPKVELQGAVVSRRAARCALPFALGAGHMITDSDLDFLVKAVDSGNIKTARYALTYVLRDDSSGESDGDDGDDGDSEHQAAPAQALKAELNEQVAREAFRRMGEHLWMQQWARSNAASEEKFLADIASGLPTLPAHYV
jgi:hypothetical protein